WPAAAMPANNETTRAMVTTNGCIVIIAHLGNRPFSLRTAGRDRLVRVGDGTQLARQRVDDVKIRHRQELRFSVGEPSARRRALTLWAMPVAARVVRDLGMAARRVLAARDMAAERRRATALDRTHDLQLLEAHMGAVGLSPRRAVIAEDVRDLQSKSNHGR